ncbi:hypothetical protein EV356DRAFT_2332 [Viridothelium virens]|uniref:Uncharacterized protein n=1 Tax=Viridothelium virens TaxID=1048519 RepID=A0A6A6HPB0_VIRVR|nr:hypothetical protein EV356DRAFT_2332 [Viridothelium virens]
MMRDTEIAKGPAYMIQLITLSYCYHCRFGLAFLILSFSHSFNHNCVYLNGS